MARLLRPPHDDEELRRATEVLDGIQRNCAALPPLAVPAMALMMSHTELLLALYRAVEARARGEEELLDDAWAEHQECLEHLRVRCLRPLLKSLR